MANNLRKFNTYSDYEAAELVKPAVSLIAATDEVYFDQKDAPVPPTPTFSGLTVHYNITDISQPTELFKGGGGSGSGSGSGGVLPSAMIIDGTAVEVTNTYQFSTTGEHIVQYSFADNQIPEEFLYGGPSENFNNVVKIVIGDAITSIGINAFAICARLTSVTIGSGVTSIGGSAFNMCTSLTSINIPSGVTTIGNDAFGNCFSLTSITIPDSVTSIDDLAFQDCSGLTSITSNAMTAPTLGNAVFDGVSTNGVLTVPSGSQGYCGWIGGGELPSYWTIEGVTCE